MRVLLPAPDGPMMAVSSPDRKQPVTESRIVFEGARRRSDPPPSATEYVTSWKSKLKAGRRGSAVPSAAICFTCKKKTTSEKVKNPFLFVF